MNSSDRHSNRIRNRYSYRIDNRYSYRIDKEIEMINSRYKTKIFYDNDYIIISLKISLYNISIIIRCSKICCYPFYTPVVYINNKSYCDFLYKMSKKISYLYKNKYKCLCCNNILTKWTPIKLLIDIINEINNVIIKNSTHVELLFVEKIINKYNLPRNISKFIH